MVRQNWRTWRASFPISEIEADLAAAATQQATTFGGENLEHRRSRIAWLSDNEKIKSLMLPYIHQAKDIMGIDVSDDCEVQFTEYYAAEGGKYDWHHDVDWNNGSGMDRKLSLTVQLSSPDEYEGGGFEFNEVEQPPEWYKDQGTVLVFPSYLQHRVLPVTAGVRRSLVAWFSGPAWR